MKMATNTQVRRAITKLIGEYKRDVHSSSTDNCSLCKLFYNDKLNSFSIEDINKNCVGCPNIVFKDFMGVRWGRFGCISRCREFKNLSWYGHDKSHLVKFWTEVYDLIPVTPKGEKLEFVLTKEISKGILTIAEKYKNNSESKESF